jgi:predicted ester cyclase
VTLDDLLADGDKVIRRFTLRGTHWGPFLGVPGSDRSVVLRGMAIDRLVDGRLVESWVHVDGPPARGATAQPSRS